MNGPNVCSNLINCCSISGAFHLVEKSEIDPKSIKPYQILGMFCSVTSVLILSKKLINKVDIFHKKNQWTSMLVPIWNQIANFEAK